MNAVNLGIIGCGDIGRSVLTLCKFTPGVRVGALCDIDPEKVNKQAKRFKKSAVYTDFKRMIAESDCDAYYIALPHYLHHTVLMEVIRYGKHAFCEKPVTCTVSEANEVIAEANKSGARIAVNYQYRYDNNCYNAVMAARNGHLGRINFVRCYVPWSRDDSYFTKAPWHVDKTKAGGGTLITQGSHFLDIILWALQCEPETIEPVCTRVKFTNTEIEDFCAVQLQMKNGAVVQFASTMAEKKERSTLFEIVGEKGSAVYVKGMCSKVKFYGIKDPGYKAGGFALHPVQRSLKGFLDWVLKDKPHLCSAQEALRVLTVVEEIYRITMSRDLSP